jgi:hypothetical protein
MNMGHCLGQSKALAGVIGLAAMAGTVCATVPEWVEPAATSATMPAAGAARASPVLLQQQCDRLLAQLNASMHARNKLPGGSPVHAKGIAARAATLCVTDPQQGIDVVRLALRRLGIRPT